MILDYHANTNYSVVDADLIEELYRREYQEKVLGTPRLRAVQRLPGGRGRSRPATACGPRSSR